MWSYLYNFCLTAGSKDSLAYDCSQKRRVCYSWKVRKLYEEVHHIHIGYGTYGGCFCLENIPQGVSFGNYCSVASGVRIFRANHPMDRFTMHPIFYNPIMGYVKKDMLERPSLEIGHDVWIGANAIILPSVTKIGNGAVIGAGSIVTHNVAPYEIVAGNPARVIKKRFSDRQIAALEATRWWEWDKMALIERVDELDAIVKNS